MNRVDEIYNIAVMTEGADNALHWGPTHIIWEDGNYTDRDIAFCKEELKKATEERLFNKKILTAVEWSLAELEKIPERERLEMTHRTNDWRLS